MSAAVYEGCHGYTHVSCLCYHSRKFYEPMDLSVQSVRQVVTGRVSTDHMDLAFAKFLTHYLHLSVYGVMTKVGD